MEKRVNTHLVGHQLTTQPPEIRVQQPVHEWIPQTIAQSRPGDEKIQERGQLQSHKNITKSELMTGTWLDYVFAILYAING